MAPEVKNILFYGDSNTWGYTPGDGSRIAYESRWTTLAARQLGDGCRCIACGLNGRTTAFEHPGRPCRNASATLDCDLQTHKPLDLIVIMLGTNDLKFVSAQACAKGMENLIVLTKTANERFDFTTPVFPRGAKILLVSPVHLGDAIVCHMDPALSPKEQVRKLRPLYEAIAQRHGAYFLDAADFAEVSPIDGEHLTPDSHVRLAAAIAQKIKEIL